MQLFVRSCWWPACCPGRWWLSFSNPPAEMLVYVVCEGKSHSIFVNDTDTVGRVKERLRCDTHARALDALTRREDATAPPRLLVCLQRAQAEKPHPRFIDFPHAYHLIAPSGTMGRSRPFRALDHKSLNSLGILNGVLFPSAASRTAAGHWYACARVCACACAWVLWAVRCRLCCTPRSLWTAAARRSPSTRATRSARSRTRRRLERLLHWRFRARRCCS